MKITIRIKLFFTVIIIAAIANSLVAQPISKKIIGDTYTKSHPTKQFSINSTNVKGREFKMHVTYAMDSYIEGKKYPVLYYTDGWLGSIELFNSMGNILAKQVEPVILVGISFEANDSSWFEIRKEDFLPNISNPDTINGAKNFLKFMKDELIPYVENNYPEDSNDRGLFGYSLGGLFSTWLLRNEPLLFKRMGISSPSLWYKNFTLLDDQKLLENIKNAKDLKVFVSYGSAESKMIIPGSDRLFDLLNANKNIQSTKFIFDSDNHFTAYPPSCMKVLT